MTSFSRYIPHKKGGGFTLLEIAVVLLIIGLLTGGILGPLSNQIEQRKISDTQKLLEITQDALLGYAVAKGRLPCPAISASNGNEDRTSGLCTGGKRVGFIPWVTLGTQKNDSWGRLFRYGVSPAFSNAQIVIASVSDIDIRTRDNTSVNTISLASNVSVMVMSHGPNGFGGYYESGALVADTSITNIDEKTNYANATTNQFIKRDLTANLSASGGEFDDIVTWMPSSILFNRMVAAGQLP
jgi:type II secretory pathway pseudopilin PulG